MTVKGTLEVGKKLKAQDLAAAEPPADVTFTYQWLRNGKAIKKATGARSTSSKRQGQGQEALRSS